MATYLDSTGLTLVLTKIKNQIDGRILKGGLKTINGASLEGSGNITLVATESDPIFTASPAYGITADNITAWTNAAANAASQITAEQIATWNSKLSSESDPIFTAHVAYGITKSMMDKWDAKLSSFTETDPIFTASAASGITEAMMTNWTTAYSNSHTHSNKDVLDGITSSLVSNWNTASTNSHTHSNSTVLDGITSTKVSNWDTAYTNNHTHSNSTVLAGITSTKVSNWDTASTNSHTHSNSSALADITSAKITAWDAKLDSSALTGYATETFVTTEIGKMSHLEFKIVNAISDVTETGYIYLIADETAGTNDVYTEYAFINNKAEVIGSTKVDIEAIGTSDLTTILTTTGFITSE